MFWRLHRLFWRSEGYKGSGATTYKSIVVSAELFGFFLLCGMFKFRIYNMLVFFCFASQNGNKLCIPFLTVMIRWPQKRALEGHVKGMWGFCNLWSLSLLWNMKAPKWRLVAVRNPRSHPSGTTTLHYSEKEKLLFWWFVPAEACSKFTCASQRNNYWHF